jgi:methionyl-tRNA formyltransferase
MGTPDLARTCLEALLKCPAITVVAVVSQPDRPKGRDLKLQPSPVKELARRHQLPVLQPERARSEEFFAALKELAPEIIIVAAYGQILPQRILDLPALGCLNVHTSLLPRYRGAAPIQWAILNGDSETGVTVMKMDAGMDTGGIIAMEQTVIEARENAQMLHDRLATMGANLMVRTVPDYAAGRLPARPQPAEGVSYAPKINKQDGRINWGKTAREIRNRVRGLVPWPGAYTSLPRSDRALMLKIWEAEESQNAGTSGELLSAGPDGIVVGCGKGSLRILLLQLEGGKKLAPGQFLTGHPLSVGTRLG